MRNKTAEPLGPDGIDSSFPEYPGVFRSPGDWIAAAAVAPFAVSVFFLGWLSIGISWNAFGRTLVDADVKTLGLLEIPWYWPALLAAAMAAVLFCLFLPSLRGAVTLAGGVIFLLFNAVFLFGAWYKINAVIGDITAAVRSVPYIGGYLGALVTEISKNVLVVSIRPGYYLFMAAGALLVAGGLIRLLAKPGSRGRRAANHRGGSQVD